MEDYEKKYKELLEKAKDFNFQGYIDEECLYDMFPELRESEDEKIRKTIVSVLEQNIRAGFDHSNGFKFTEMIAWLEKQKDINSKEYVFRPYAGCDINTAAIIAVEKQKLGNKIVLAFNGAYIPVEEKTADDIVNEYYSWLEKQELTQSVTKISDKVWSEEDEIGFADTLWAIQQARTIAKDENDMGNLWYAEDWLKSLKQRLGW